MAKRSIGLRLAPLIMVLAVALSACGFSTDTVATVGGARITRGELNAAIAGARARAAITGEPTGAATVLDSLIDDRMLELAARDQGIQVSRGEIAALIASQVRAVAAGLDEERTAQLDSLAVSAAREIRPVVNANGGNALPEATLQAVVRREIDTLRALLASRGTTLTFGGDLLTDREIADQAIVLRNALAGQGVGVPPETLEPVIAILAQRLGSGTYLATPADDFQMTLNGAGYTNEYYQQRVRRAVLQEKLRQAWYKPSVQAITLQGLVADSQAKALEAVQKGRAGTPFADLVKAYHLPAIRSQLPDNTIGQYVVDLLPRDFVQRLKIEEGAYSEPVASADGRQFTVYRIAKVEQRAPTQNEENGLAQAWLEGQRSRYNVTIADPALRPATTR